MKILYALSILLLVGIGCKSKVANTQTGITFKDVDPIQANSLIKDNDKIIILDVRTPEETALGTLPNAITIDYLDSSFDTEIAKLDKSKPYLVYCRSGGRSTGACNKLIAAGFTDITNMQGGYTEWSK